MSERRVCASCVFWSSENGTFGRCGKVFVEQNTKAGWLITNATDHCAKYEVVEKITKNEEPTPRPMPPFVPILSDWEKDIRDWKLERLRVLYPKLGAEVCAERLGLSAKQLKHYLEKLRRLGVWKSRQMVDWDAYDSSLMELYPRMSATKTAAALSKKYKRRFTNNMVIGRANRLGLKKKGEKSHVKHRARTSARLSYPEPSARR